MAIIRRVRKDSFSYPPFFGGMFFGGIVVFILFGPQHNTSLHNKKSPLLDIEPNSGSEVQQHLRRESETSDNTVDDGWHPIHVFYGKKSGLGADPNRKFFAQVHQDEVILDILGPNGYFIDLAANDALDLTNTLALENAGWEGLCVEPNPVYWYGLSHRKCTVVGALLGDDTVEEVSVKFRGVFGGIVGKMDDKLANYKKEPNANEEKRFTAPIKQVLQKFNVPKVIDYLSLDVEGAEYMIMKNFPFSEYSIKFMTIERPDKDLKALLEKEGYIHLKDFAWWGETLWTHKSTGYTPEHPKIVKIQTEGKK